MGEEVKPEAFFAAIRPSFGGKLSQRQVDGMTALLEAGRDLPLHHMANVLAQVRRETGGIMAPIKETVMAHHRDQNPTDATVKARLEKAWKAGKLKGVKVPYWREGWFGRGQIQITHEKNYRKFGIEKPEEALKPAVSARIAVTGMRDGLFTSRKLSDFGFPADLGAPVSRNPRRIVNGNDGSDAEVARFHMAFAEALEAAGWGKETPAAPVPAPEAEGWLAALVRALAAMFGRKG
jgi:hypothetical protein